MKKAIQHLRDNCQVMRGLVETIGTYKMSYREPTFESMIRSIVFQQLSTKAASTIYGRVATAVGEMTPEGILACSTEQLRGWGLSGQKVTYVRDLAEKTRSGLVRFQDLPSLPDQAVIDHLTQVKGVGVWSAQMFLMFALRRPDVLPTGDLGIRNAIQRAFRMRQPPKPDRMEKVARPWRPYATVACWYLWRSLDGPAEF